MLAAACGLELCCMEKHRAARCQSVWMAQTSETTFCSVTAACNQIFRRMESTGQREARESACPRNLKTTSGGLQTQVQVYVSFGGLLMQLTGDVDKLQELQVDSNVYLLLKKG